MNTSAVEYDLIIVGGGPIGLTCAIEAEKKGISYIVLEKGTLVDSLYHFPTNMTFFSTSALLEIGDVPFISHSDKPTRREALEYFRRVQEAWDLNIRFYEEVTAIEKNGELFSITTPKRNYKSSYVIVATGFYGQPKLMDVPGEELDKVRHYYQEAHPYLGQKVLVVGAANSACDVALELFHKGADVTMVVRGEGINPRVKYWIRPNIENRIKEGSIKAYFKSQILRIEEDQVLIQTPEGQKIIPNDYVLAMTGYVPDYPFLDKIGILRNDQEPGKPQVDPETLESNIENLFLAGVIVAGDRTSTLFIENSRVHAEIIMEQIKKKEKVLQA
ncbi:YpdA family putative bacillithiol disulfide reductase [Membranicola marinus]|uniref:YpdA family putative bacillithiol disulfide reductase n=1 Tax=Membranihabitans marinus TaxID=1227546 RepID=A0A953LEI3_9BACT|nr:YpdA family putative bacillithiol disulfide reductase [Membranihabitans marinus]MBY5959999.1 YpdA family putative bacillithiol disulfide reductase [Membranihabitans marinus]